MPHAAASAMHSCRNRTLSATRRPTPAPALLVPTLKKPVLPPLEWFEDKYVRGHKRCKFIELSDDDKEEVNRQV